MAKSLSLTAGDTAELSAGGDHSGHHHGGHSGHQGHDNKGEAHEAAKRLRFTLASARRTRFSFTTGSITASASGTTPVTPIQIPAVGYLAAINLEVTITGSGGTSPAFKADSPFNALSTVNLKTPGGADIIVPLSGWDVYLMNKYGCQFATAPMSDARLSPSYSADAPSAHFFLQLPLQIDARSALGAIPAAASNRNYQLNLTIAEIATFLSGAPSVTVEVRGTAHYWSIPPKVSQTGIPQEWKPEALGTLSQWQFETPPVVSGDNLVKLINVGNVINLQTFTLRDSSGARDGDDWPDLFHVYVDDEERFQLTSTEWIDLMAKWYGFHGDFDDAGGLDTGVYVLPYPAWMNSIMGPANVDRDQLLITLDTTQLQVRGTFGPSASQLQVATNSYIPKSAHSLFGK